jgi:2-phosphosulfolactate phosphatase
VDGGAGEQIVRIDVAFTPAEARGLVSGRQVVVIDVLRATSTIVHALLSGARHVVPAANVEEAARLAEQIGRDAVLLCGERDTQPISGFDLGNSPLEFTPERVAGKTLVMTTTNGTPALRASSAAASSYVGSLLNVSAVARRLVGAGVDALLLCAGREGAFALEDAHCAGRILRHVRAARTGVRGNDAAEAALRLAARPATERMLGRTAAGRRLAELGQNADIAFCAQEDLCDVLPVLDDQRIRL